MKFENITLSQINLMKHALGLDQTKAKPKRGKYIAYRNYFCSYGKNAEWESLVECNLAISRVGNLEIYPNSIFYYVSKDGIDLLEKLFGFKIIESD